MLRSVDPDALMWSRENITFDAEVPVNRSTADGRRRVWTDKQVARHQGRRLVVLDGSEIEITFEMDGQSVTAYWTVIPRVRDIVKVKSRTQGEDVTLYGEVLQVLWDDTGQYSGPKCLVTLGDASNEASA